MVLGINPNEGKSVAKQFAEEFGIEFPVLVDGRGSVYSNYQQFGMTPFPLDYIIDQEGIVRYFNTEYRPQEMIKVIESLLETTDVNQPDHRKTIPQSFSLQQNFPNPITQQKLSNQGTKISFQLPQNDFIELEIYNVKGQKVNTIFSGNLLSGEHIFQWNGGDLSKIQVASGIYFVTLTSSKLQLSKKLIILP